MENIKLEKIYENSFATLEYHRDKEVIHCTYHGTVNIDLGIKMFQAILDATSEIKIRGGIFNCLDMKGTYTSVNKWLKEEFYPKMVAQGYVCWSMATTDIFTQFAGNLLINKITPKEVTAIMFRDMDKAVEWTYNFLENRDKNS